MKLLLRLFLASALLGAFGLTSSAQQPKKQGGGGTKNTTGTKGEITGGLPADATKLHLGDAAPDFKLLGIDGRTYTLADFPAKSAPVLMVVFLSNHCPYSHAAETRLIPFAREFSSKGLAVVAINPNSPDGVRIDELGYSKYNDSYEEMKLYAKDAGFPFPYLYDGDTQVTAKAYGCLATPHVFLFDRERKLRYVGRVDDSRFEELASVKSHDTRNAVVELLAGKPVTVAQTTVMGCSTKWNTKRDDVAKADAKWKAEPVDLLPVDAAGVAALAKNTSNRLRLVNVWATWCAPCVAEFPALVSLSRRFSTRDFELVTISLDDPKLKAQAKAFLEKQHAVPSARLKQTLAAEGRQTANFIYTDASTDALVKALDPEWPGPLPHTVLIAPGGKILWRHNGAVDPAELLQKTVEALGPYYTP
jgi:peroxiredoxin